MNLFASKLFNYLRPHKIPQSDLFIDNVYFISTAFQVHSLRISIVFSRYPDTIEEFKEKLADYKCAKGAIQFALDKPLPKYLIVERVRLKLEQISGQSDHVIITGMDAKNTRHC